MYSSPIPCVPNLFLRLSFSTLNVFSDFVQNTRMHISLLCKKVTTSLLILTWAANSYKKCYGTKMSLLLIPTKMGTCRWLINRLVLRLRVKMLHPEKPSGLVLKCGDGAGACSSNLNVWFINSNFGFLFLYTFATSTKKKLRLSYEKNCYLRKTTFVVTYFSPTPIFHYRIMNVFLASKLWWVRHFRWHDTLILPNFQGPPIEMDF